MDKMKKISLYLFILLYLLAGINHFWHPHSYDAIIPPYLPWHELINYAAGTCEIILAIGMMFKSTRKLAAYVIIAMLVAFIPAHIYMIEKAPFAMGAIQVTPFAAWIRLLVFQPLLIAWAWWVRK
ncbi:MAG: DoxX family protein [Chitinophagaceae bacterium]|nr:DoxX family protein [Chitinophagaceae bacterium]